jgi:hypothetical protein
MLIQATIPVVLVRRGLLVLFVLAPSLAAADRRSFTRTHEYLTMSRGDTEIAVHSTQSLATFDDDSPEAFELQLEVQHGITDRWDVSLRHIFDQATGSGSADPGPPFGFSEMRLRTRYRFSERGELPVDSVAFVEAAKVFGGSIYQVQARAILARDLGLVTVSLNPIAELQLGGDVPDPALALGWAAGISYDARPTLEVGVETWGDFAIDAFDEAAISVGPALSWAPVPAFWIATTIGFGANDNAAALDLRVIVGMRL